MNQNAVKLLPLTAGQNSIWIAQSLDPDSPAYNIAESTEILGKIQRDAFERAVGYTVDDTPSLALAFIETADGPKQFLAPDRPWILHFVDFSSKPDPQSAARAWMQSDLAVPVDIYEGRPFRVALLRLAAQQHWFYAVNHHLVNDAIGAHLVLRRLAQRYRELVLGIEASHSKLISIDEILAYENSYRRSSLFARDRDYCLLQSTGRPSASLAADHSEPANAVEQANVLLDPTLDLDSFGRRYQASAAAIMLAAVTAYLFLQTGETDPLIGLQTSTRIGQDMRNAVGPTTNTTPLRVTFKPSATFADLVRLVARRMREALRRQQYRIEDLRRDLGLSPDEPNPFSAVVNFFPLDEPVSFTDQPCRRQFLGNWRVDDIMFASYNGGAPNARRIHVIGNAARYSEPIVRLHSERFHHLLRASLQAPETSCDHLDRMSPSERRRILIDFNGARGDEPHDSFVHSLFERRAREHPERPALKSGEVEWSYSELNGEANRLARCLKENGVGPDAPVVVCIERSATMVLAIIAVLKAGGAYVPIDPRQPSERIAWVFRDTAARIVLTSPQTNSQMPASRAKIIIVDAQRPEFRRYSAADLDTSEPALTPDRLAYVFYTSGSTGIPKGVMVEHRALTHRLLWMQRQFELDENDCVLLKTPYTFDVSVWEFLWPLMTGARLVVSSPFGHLDPEYLTRVIIAEGVTTLQFVPSMLLEFVKQAGARRCESLRRIFAIGEELPAALAQECMRLFPQANLFNLYGPTEAAIHVTHWTCAPGQDLVRVPIGRPIDDVQVYILDAQREPVAIGALGEIYLAGVGLARGYLNRPELDAELFIPCPFDSDPTARMYKTGDLGLWRPDGAIEYHGRNDNQVKIRGVRIELGEIETQLKFLPNVRDAAVAVERRTTGEQRLIAFYVLDPLTKSEADPNAGATLRRQLSRRLPEQMIPNAFIRLDALPLTANGKLDRRTLLDRVASPAAETSDAAHAISNTTELALAEIWRDLLGRDDFGRLDDFFDLGGHSLLATRMRSQVRSRFAVDLPLKVVFETRTLGDLATAVDEALAGQSHRGRQRIKPTPESDAYVLSHSQQRMWLNQSLDPESTAYNLVGAFRLKGSLNVDALSRAFDELRRRHESLRSVFYDMPQGVRQRVLPFSPEPLEAIDLRRLKKQALADAVRAAEEDARKPFDLATGPVMRTLLFRTADDEHLLYLSLHHISGDQWSFGVMGREISATYSAFCEGRAPDLEPLPVQYRDYASWRRSDAEVAAAQAELAYWAQKLDGLPALELPTDFSRPRLKTSSGAFVLVPLPTPLLSRLERLGRREGATLFMTMLTGFALQLSRLTGQTDIAIGAPIANRTHSELEALVGTFVNTLVMRIDLSERPTFRELLDRVRRTALEAYSHQDASFDELVQLVHRPRDDGRPPLTQVMFNMLNAPFFASSLDRLASEQVFIDRGGAQFELSVSVDAQVLNAIVFEYNIDLFRRSSIERFAAQYLQLLESIVEDTATPISKVNLLPPAEAKLLLEDWNATQTPPLPEPTFIAMFEAQAAARPNAEALRFQQDAISYRELDRTAEAVSRHLRARGVRPGVGVGVCLVRTPLLLAVLLGVQKAGGHYIPLDPATPRKRLEYTLADAGPLILIADPEICSTLSVGQELMRIDPKALALPPPESEGRFEAGADDLAYIIYTSGSTGRPKGVRVTQRALANFLDAMRRRPGMTERDSLVAVTTVSFDISGLEFYLPLSVGGRVVLAPTDVAADGERLAELLGKSGATVLQATPATWRMLLEAGWTGSRSLRAFCGGEALSADLAHQLLPRVGELWNLYGPTETTIWSTVARIGAQEPISIGAPINNTRVYIVDAEGQICPIGIAGEICIAGDGVAEGYQNLPELTRERFQRDPFVADANQRLYKTGDLGVWGEDGRLYHRGRSDNQLKIRGFRIEAEEVETLLRSHPAIRDAVVATRDAGGEDLRLVGYLIAETGVLPPSSEMRAFLRETAPSYMAPSIFVEIDKFPLTPSGKLDRKALPDPFASPAAPTTTYEDPAPGAEQVIADVWRDVLKTNAVGANDNFFELGGHSLLALRVAALVEMKTGWRMDPRTLYFQTLRQVAAAADSLDAAGRER